MPLKFDGTIKLDINVAITATFTILLFLGNQMLQQQTSQVVTQSTDETKQVVHETAEKNKNQAAAIINILKTVSLQGNNTALTQKQMLQLTKQILAAVN